MRNFIRKMISGFEHDGISSVFKKGITFMYNRKIAPRLNRYVSPRISKTTVEYNGISVAVERDFHIHPFRDDRNKPHYESGLILGLDNCIKKGDKVVIVGGGKGVTTVKASQKTGETGKVISYEGSTDEVQIVRSTTDINDTPSQIDIVHGIVGEKKNLYNDSRGAVRLAPEQLPGCDVLELDCEGSEVEILKNLLIKPRVILVETHGMYNASSTRIEKLLEEIGFSVVSSRLAVKDSEFCISNDIHVLVATQ